MRKNKTVKKAKKQISHKSNESLSMEEREILLNECFYTDSEDFKKMWEIIQRSLDNPSQNSCIEKHHIVPRSYFKKVGRDYIDDGNLVSLPAYDHYKVHYFAWKCAKPLMERSMTMAFNFMAKKCMKIIDDNDLNFSSFMYEQFREEHRKSISRSLKDYYSDEKTRDAISKRVEEKWRDPEYKKRLKEIDEACWEKRHQKMFPENKAFTLEIKFLSECYGKVPNQTAREIYGDEVRRFTDDQLEIFNIKDCVTNERVSYETLYFCDEIGFIGTKKDLAYIFNVSESVIVDCAKCEKKLNNIEIKRDLHPNKWKLLDSFIKFLYPLYKKQGEHLFDTLRNIFKLMDKNSTD